jgi:hypothetical protein
MVFLYLLQQIAIPNHEFIALAIGILLHLMTIDDLHQANLFLHGLIHFLAKDGVDGIEVDDNALDELIDVLEFGLIEDDFQHIVVIDHVRNSCFKLIIFKG